MITEDYVSFETAKILKEKGFNERCDHYFELYQDNEHFFYPISFLKNSTLPENCYFAPTLQMAVKWLREKHSIDIIPCLIDYNTITIPQDYYFFKLYKDRRPLLKNIQPERYHTYEQAIRAAIKYCIENLI